jgi:hypothetical protein
MPLRALVGRLAPIDVAGCTGFPESWDKWAN